MGCVSSTLTYRTENSSGDAPGLSARSGGSYSDSLWTARPSPPPRSGPRSVPAGLQKLSFQLGLGLSASISSANGHWQRRYYDTYNHPEVESGNFNEVGFGIRSNIMMGLRYDFTEHFSALAEVSVGFIGGAASSSRIGVLYRF